MRMVQRPHKITSDIFFFFFPDDILGALFNPLVADCWFLCLTLKPSKPFQLLMQGKKGRLGLPSRHAMGGWFWEVEEDGCQKSSKTSAKTAAALRTCFAEREVVFRVVRAQHRVVVCWQRRLRRRALVQRAVLGFSTKKKKKKKKIKKMRYISKTWNMSGEVLAPCMLTMPAFHTHTH